MRQKKKMKKRPSKVEQRGRNIQSGGHKTPNRKLKRKPEEKVIDWQANLKKPILGKRAGNCKRVKKEKVRLV